MRFGANNHQNHIYNGRKIGEGDSSFLLRYYISLQGTRRNHLTWMFRLSRHQAHIILQCFMKSILWRIAEHYGGCSVINKLICQGGLSHYLHGIGELKFTQASILKLQQISWTLCSSWSFGGKTTKSICQEVCSHWCYTHLDCNSSSQGGQIQ